MTGDELIAEVRRKVYRLKEAEDRMGRIEGWWFCQMRKGSEPREDLSSEHMNLTLETAALRKDLLHIKALVAEVRDDE